jgi:hypothetical protein
MDKREINELGDIVVNGKLTIQELGDKSVNVTREEIEEFLEKNKVS